jgi:hypothetical protein
MNADTRLARPCRCEVPLLDGESCIRCGRAAIVLPPAEAPPPPPVQRQITWTRPGVVRAIRAFAFFRGRAPNPQDWHGRMPDDWPSIGTVERLFGSIGAAVSAAGLEPRPPQRRTRTRAA